MFQKLTKYWFFASQSPETFFLFFSVSAALTTFIALLFFLTFSFPSCLFKINNTPRKTFRDFFSFFPRIFFFTIPGTWRHPIAHPHINPFPEIDFSILVLLLRCSLDIKVIMSRKGVRTPSRPPRNASLGEACFTIEPAIGSPLEHNRMYNWPYRRHSLNFSAKLALINPSQSSDSNLSFSSHNPNRIHPRL